jgi:hypothetical protein
MRKKINLAGYDWVIMRASAWIPGKPSLDKIIVENNYEGTVIVGKISLYDNEPKPMFLLGAKGTYTKENKASYEGKQRYSFIKDTGNGYKGEGYIEVENIIQITDCNIESKLNDIGINEKRPLYVFK